MIPIKQLQFPGQQDICRQLMSKYTRQLAETGKRPDRTLTGMGSAIKAALHHPDPNSSTADYILWHDKKRFIIQRYTVMPTGEPNQQLCIFEYPSSNN
jgi:hypothetical protein